VKHGYTRRSAPRHRGRKLRHRSGDSKGGRGAKGARNHGQPVDRKARRGCAYVTGSVETRTVDMLDEAAVTSSFGSIGRVDHLVLTAVSDENKRRAPIAELTTEQMERALDKLRGFFFVTRAATPHLAPRGSITVTSGASALKPPRQGMSILAAVNAAVATFARALALELAPIRVNALTPGVVDTPVWDGARRAGIKQWAESSELPAQRFGLPEDLADAILFVITNPYVTGHNLVVDGGLSAT
jgi:NAD(P)-dependent dehydrogenase (short-subunit alcohol dehydrogenase family)